MISEFSVHPKPSNKKAKTTFITLLVISGVIVFVYILAKNFKGVIGLLAIGFLTAAILIYTKYICVEFYYDITFDANQNPIFIVRQKIGKRETTLCYANLYSIVKVEKESAQERKTHITPKEYSRYNCTPTMSPKEVYRITASGHYEKNEIVIECSDDFADLLAENAKEAREIHNKDEEDY